jgi:hypothetical protein
MTAARTRRQPGRRERVRERSENRPAPAKKPKGFWTGEEPEAVIGMLLDTGDERWNDELKLLVM